MGQMKEISTMLDEYIENEVLPPIITFIDSSSDIRIECMDSSVSDMIREYLWTKVVSELNKRKTNG